MDVMAPGFRPDSCDCFLIEFYGYQPSMSRNITLQRYLAHVLRDEGIGFVVASRKKYASYWYLMGSPYPAIMTNWLQKQSILDHLYTQPDGNEGYSLVDYTTGVIQRNLWPPN
jgi:hypothetical protein